MHIRKPLSFGTVLHGNNREYHIVRVVAEGGTSLVYDAYIENLDAQGNVSTKDAVLVKECYPLKVYCIDRDDDGRTLFIPERASEQNQRFDMYKRRFRSEVDVYNALTVSEQDGIRREKAALFQIPETFNENGTVYTAIRTEDNCRLFCNLSDLAPYELCICVRDLLRALGEIHKANYLHLDLCPRNIVRLSNGSVKIIDLNSALHMEKIGEATRFSSSPGFSAPSTERSHERVSVQTDLYSVGAILFYFLNDFIPISDQQAQHPESLRRYALPRAKEFGRHAQSLLQDILRQSIVWNSDKRFKSAEAFEKAMGELCHAIRPSKPHLQSVIDTPKNTYRERRADEEHIHDLFFQKGKRAVFLHGIGGIGKSQLARGYAARYDATDPLKTEQSGYRTIVVADYRKSGSFEALLNDLPVHTGGGDDPPQQRRQKRLDCLKDLTDATLIVVDQYDVEDTTGGGIDAFLRSLGSAHVLFTTQLKAPYAKCDGETWKIPALEREPLLAIAISGYTDDTRSCSQQEIEGFERLIEYSGAHTMFIELAGRHCRHKQCTPLQLHEKLLKDGLKLSTTDGRIRYSQDGTPTKNDWGTPYDFLIGSMFRMSKHAESEYSHLDVAILQSLALSPGFAFRIDLFCALLGKGEPLAMERIEELQQLSLISTDGQGKITLHPLIQKAVREEYPKLTKLCRQYVQNSYRFIDARLSPEGITFGCNEQERENFRRFSDGIAQNECVPLAFSIIRNCDWLSARAATFSISAFTHHLRHKHDGNELIDAKTFLLCCRCILDYFREAYERDRNYITKTIYRATRENVFAALTGSTFWEMSAARNDGFEEEWLAYERAAKRESFSEFIRSDSVDDIIIWLFTSAKVEENTVDGKVITDHSADIYFDILSIFETESFLSVYKSKFFSMVENAKKEEAEADAISKKREKSLSLRWALVSFDQIAVIFAGRRELLKKEFDENQLYVMDELSKSNLDKHMIAQQLRWRKFLIHVCAGVGQNWSTAGTRYVDAVDAAQWDETIRHLQNAFDIFEPDCLNSKAAFPELQEAQNFQMWATLELALKTYIDIMYAKGFFCESMLFMLLYERFAHKKVAYWAFLTVDCIDSMVTKELVDVFWSKEPECYLIRQATDAMKSTFRNAHTDAYRQVDAMWQQNRCAEALRRFVDLLIEGGRIQPACETLTYSVDCIIATVLEFLIENAEWRTASDFVQKLTSDTVQNVNVRFGVVFGIMTAGEDRLLHDLFSKMPAARCVWVYDQDLELLFCALDRVGIRYDSAVFQVISAHGLLWALDMDDERIDRGDYLASAIRIGPPDRAWALIQHGFAMWPEYQVRKPFWEKEQRSLSTQRAMQAFFCCIDTVRDQRSAACPVCGATVVVDRRLPVGARGVCDLDLRPAQPAFRALHLDLMECPACGYIAESFPDQTCVDRAFLMSEHYWMPDLPQCPPQAGYFLRAARIAEVEKDSWRAAQFYLAGAWTCDDVENDEGAVMCRRRALQALESVRPIDPFMQNTVCVLKTDLLRRTGVFEQAIASASADMPHCDDVAKKVLCYERKLSERKDMAVHRITEVLPNGADYQPNSSEAHPKGSIENALQLCSFQREDVLRQQASDELFCAMRSAMKQYVAGGVFPSDEFEAACMQYSERTAVDSTEKLEQQ